MLRCLLWSAPFVLAAAPVVAQERGVTLSVTGGTLGVGPEVGVRINNRLGVRADAAVLRTDLVDVEATSDDIAFGGNVRIRSGSALADFYPLGTGIRLSAGIRVSSVKAAITATPTTNVTIGTRNVTPAQIGKLRADYRLRDWAPAATIGYAGELMPRLVAGVDAGLLFHGAPQIRRLRSIGGTLSADPGFVADLERERMLIKNDIEDYRLYPIVQASIGYRF